MRIQTRTNEEFKAILKEQLYEVMKLCDEKGYEDAAEWIAACMSLNLDGGK